MPWDDTARPQLREQLDGARERPPLRQQLAEQLAVAALQLLGLLLGELAPARARRPGEQAAAHPDTPVDPPPSIGIPSLGESPLPGKHVRIDGIDQRPVEIEDEGSRHAPRA